MAGFAVAIIAEPGAPVSAGTRAATALGRMLADQFCSPLVGVLPGDDAGAATEWARLDGLRVILARAPGLSDYEQQSFLSAVASILATIGPALIVIAHGTDGADYAPRLAARLGMPYVPSVCGVDGRSLTRQAMGGKVTERVELTGPAVVTVSPGAFAAQDGSGDGIVEVMELKPSPPAALYRERVAGSAPDAGLARAEVIVAVGRGAGPEGIALARELAGCFRRGALGASRPLIDAGLLHYELQVGQTGATVSPRVYLACGISGALQHVAGMSASNFIVAINTDANAPIFRSAHLGAVMDLRELLPELIAELKK